MQDTVETRSDSKLYVIDDYVHILFEQFKNAPFERIVLMAFARVYDLVQAVSNNALPKGHKHFAESDVRECIRRFHKQTMQLNFVVANNALIATGRPPLALGDYSMALRNLWREFSRC